MKIINNKGFGVIPIIAILITFGILSFVGLLIINSKTENKTTEQATTTDITGKSYQTTGDLDSTSKELDDVQVDLELETSDLTNDINSVL